MLNFKNIIKVDYPYPALIIENIFEEKFLENLVVEFPNHKEFIKYKKTMVNRRFLSNDNPDFYNYINKNHNWHEFYQYINSSETYKKILKLLLGDKNTFEKEFYNLKFYKEFYKKNKLSFNFSFILRELVQKIPRNRLSDFIRYFSKKIIYKKNSQNGNYLRFDISAASNGYFREPHRDSDGTILAFLIYLEDQVNIGGSGGEFIVHDKNMKISKIFTPKKNKALFFLSNKNSYHSVSKIIGAKGWRKFVYGGYTSIDKNIWNI